MTTSVVFTDLRINMAQQFIESVSEPSPNTKIYLTYGKCTAWDNDSSPPSANCSVATIYDVWSNMIGGKRLYGGDFHHVIPRYNWKSGNTYIQYDHTNPCLTEDQNVQFYIVNSEYNVYKCLSNNKQAVSTVEPTSTSVFPSETGDGYLWKYMYTINDAEKIRFTTIDYMPVKTLMSNDGSLQWEVQNTSITGAIHHIKVANTGSGYSNASNISVTIKGDGSEFAGYVTLTGNTISKVIITNTGKNYTYATATLTDSSPSPGTGAILIPVISPPGGHGSDPLYELGGKNVMVDAKLKYSEEDILPATNDFRQICLLKDPYIRSSSNVAQMTAYLQATTILCEGYDNFAQDEIVYQGTSLSTYNFKGTVLSWTPANNRLLLINTDGTVIPQKAITGATSQTVRTVSVDAVKGTLQPYSGKIMYVDNLKPITRSNDQIEDFKILVKF